MKAVATFRQAREMREIFGPIQPRLDEVESFLSREMERALAEVGEVAGWVLDAGGKRLRPALMLLVSRMLGSSGERDIRYAAVVELIHTATLLHDDIIDESDLRRGRPTANNRFGNQSAVLVGDWLYTRTMNLCLELGDVEVMRRLTAATLAMTEGELLADRIRGSVDVSLDLYMDITRRKTAELFAATCAIPALFQPSTLHLTDTLLEFGRDLGVCFQLVDDLLDFTADRRRLGKPVMADLREGRVTLPVLLLLERCDPATRAAIAEVASSGEFAAISEQEVLDRITTSGVLEETRRRARELGRRALDRSTRFPDGPEREALARAAVVLVDRGS